MQAKMRQKNPIKKVQTQNNQKEESQEKQQQEKQQQKKQQKKQENDDLVNELMMKDIEHAEDEVNKMIEQTLKQVDDLEEEERNLSRMAQKQEKNQQDANPLQNLLRLTQDEKIQYFYQYLSIDHISQYRKKMSSLSLPIFQNPKLPKNRSSYELEAVQSANLNAHENPRIIQFKEKLQERRQKAKEISKKILRESERPEIRNKPGVFDIRATAQRSQSPHDHDVKNVRILSGPISLAMINRATLEDLKIPKFNPSQLFSIEESDRKFLGDYALPKRILNSENNKQSRSVVQKANKRVTEVEKIEKNQKKKLNQASNKKDYRSQKIVNKF